MLKFILFVLLFTQTYAQTLQLSWYGWEALKIYNKNPQSFLQKLPPTNRIFLSLSPQELQAIKYSNYEANKLKQFISSMHTESIKVVLLLGDPHYIYKKEFLSLISIINLLKEFEFKAIMLDIEASDLPKTDKKLWKNNLPLLVATIKKHTSLPIGLTLHHKESDHILLQNLVNAGLNELNLMYYSTNKTNLENKMLELLSRYKNLNFSLALSIEPVPIVKEDETFASKDYLKTLKIWSEIDAKLQKKSNFIDLVIQSLKYFNKIQNENQL